MKAPVKPATVAPTSAVVALKSVAVTAKPATSTVGPTVTTASKTSPGPKKVVLVKRLVQRSHVKSKPDCDSTAEIKNVKSIVSLKGSPDRLEVPLQRKTRVHPEQEGSYKIIMPQGNTPKTQALLKSRLGPPGKTSVFDRLSRASSSSESSQETSPKTSVFSRLGKGSEQASGNSLALGKKDGVPKNDFNLSTQFVVKQATSSTSSQHSELGMFLF